MKFSSKAPTKPGWYWVRIGSHKAVASVRESDGALLAHVPGHFAVKPAKSLGWEWAGPIEEPA